MIRLVNTVFNIAILSTLSCFGTLVTTSVVQAQNKRLQESLKIQPDQPGVDCDRPDATAMANCKVDSTNEKYGLPGWVVYDATDRMLRLFLDRNKDQKLDQWSYFKDGIEVYRDSDNDFDGKLDEFRWLGSAGMRKGIDRNEDGEIDRWEMISVEEVAQEAFYAIKYQDNARFGRLLISEQELASLELTGDVGSDIRKRVDNARKGFSAMTRNQRQIGRSTEFVYSGTGQPGVAAANKRDGITKDIVCYDHASVVFKNGERVGNVALGTIVSVGGTWRLIELPEIVDPKKPIQTGGALFPMQLVNTSQNNDQEFDNVLGELYEKFEKIDSTLRKLVAENNPKKNAVRIASIHQQKALTGIDIYNKVPAAEKFSWLQNIADTVSDAYQKEEYPSGLTFLKEFSQQLKKAGRLEGLDYIRWRSIFAEYQLIIQLKDSEAREKALDDLMANLKRFVRNYPKSDFAPDALFQLGFNNEIDNDDNNREAISMYRQLASRYKNTTFGKRAQGALSRLEGKGKRFVFKGKTARGQIFDSSRQKGKVILIHFWDSSTTDGLDEIKKLNAKWDDELIVVGANVDRKTEDFIGFMKANRDVNWTQLHAPGGTEASELAVQVGLVSMPMALLIDKDGKLADTNLAFPDLDREIQRLTR
jgi:hypothetical protein